jgi:proteic killer suppression protein
MILSAQCREAQVAIKSYKDKITEAVAKGNVPKGFPPNIAKIARRKIQLLRAAKTLSDMKVPPANKLHPLSDDRAGQYAIKINDQYRLCFVWADEGCTDVESVDYH